MGTKTETLARPAPPPKARRSLGLPAHEESDHRLYVQVARALKEEILNGIYPVGSQLPTEYHLRERFSVSRFTIREALRQLREDGLVFSRQGAGTIVVPSAPSDSYVLHAMSINDLLAFTSNTRFEIDFIKMLTIDDELAERAGVPEGDEWLTVRGYRHAEAEEAPVCWAEYYINREYAAVGRLLPRHNGPIFPLIENLFGLSIAEVHQEITSVLISRDQAARHKVKEGSAALAVRRVYKLLDGKIVQVTISTYPASRFRLSMTMRRMRA